MTTLTHLAELAGIASSYIDKMGNTHITSDDVRRFFLSSMGFDISTEENMQAAIDELGKIKLLPEVMSFYENETVSFSLQKSGVYDVQVIDENQQVILQQQVNGLQDIIITDLPFGYYNIKVSGDEEPVESLLIRAPVCAYQPDFLQQKAHLYGTAVMLYALKSEHNMGIGDFADLKKIIAQTAQAGGDVVGINPLGVMSPYTQTVKPRAKPENMWQIVQSDVSPYRTLSRLFINYVYLDLTSEPDFKASADVAQFMSDKATLLEIKALKNSKQVAYKRVLELKLKLLTMMYGTFIRTTDAYRKQKFADFCVQKGEELDNLALFETLLEVLQPTDFFREWPSEYQNLSSAEMKHFKQDYAERIKFYKYCHWLADCQLKNVAEYAKSLGMKIGVYGDMPIGAASNGAEVWENPTAYAENVGVGAPADLMRPRGQSWGFSPYHPLAIVKQHYAPFINLVRESMQNFGALRIDHAMGLQRLFWGFYTPQQPAVQGAYVYYNIKDMVAIVTLESQRRKCMVICEDLGTVPEGFREYMAEHGLLSYKVMGRQKEKDGSYIAPKDYMYMSLAQFSTHDQATSFGFWQNEDIEIFNDCGLYVSDEQYRHALDERANDRQNLVKALDQQGLLTSEDKSKMQQGTALGTIKGCALERLFNCYVAQTDSALFLVRLNDIYQQTEMDNVPGTINEYPNWRGKMRISVEEIQKDDRFTNLMRLIKEQRPK
ncbi:MAG: 4-alpha-glucanotransferase [Alphaproteobacteria bacterium]